MKAVVVYESMFGNAKAVAEAIGRGLAERMSVELCDTGAADAALTSPVDLLVVGGPNHMLGLPRPESRQQATTKGTVLAQPVTGGLREWLERRPDGHGTAAATFDTRAATPRFLRWLDHAASTEQRLLRRNGYECGDRTAHFLVAGTTGPLVEGEVDRAQRWGAQLAADLIETH